MSIFTKNECKHYLQVLDSVKLCSFSVLSSDWWNRVKGEILTNGMVVEKSKNISEESDTSCLFLLACSNT